jgi:hypothetical protein
LGFDVGTTAIEVSLHRQPQGITLRPQGSQLHFSRRDGIQLRLIGRQRSIESRRCRHRRDIDWVTGHRVAVVSRKRGKLDGVFISEVEFYF